jgi:transposase
MTAVWRNREEMVQQLVVLAKQKVSKRGIARALGIGRNTLKALLKTHDVKRAIDHSALPIKPSRLPRASKIDPFNDRIGDLLKQYPDITAQRVFETLREEGYDGEYTTVKKRVRTLRPPPRPEPSLVTPVHGPGVMAENDWSPYKIKYTDGTREEIQAFSYVLRYSTRKFYRAYRDNGLYALMEGHVKAFEKFDGCAHACLYDSQKAVVLRWEGRQPIFNPRFLAFAAHYEFRVEAVRGDPNAKARVERSFWEFERSFLNGRSFANFDDLQAQLAHWLDTVVDHRKRHGSTALERFEKEREHLLPLPRHPYDTARVVYRTCTIDGFIAWAGNEYAVPYEHVTDILPVRVTQRELFVYAADLRCIARHELAPRGTGKKFDTDGIHPQAQRKSPVDLDMLGITFGYIGEQAAEFFRQLSSGAPRIWGHQARLILLLRERYATADIDAALGHALSFGAFDSKSVERILIAHAAPRPLDEYVAEATVRRIVGTFGKTRTAPRDLREYDRLPGMPQSSNEE